MAKKHRENETGPSLIDEFPDMRDALLSIRIGGKPLFLEDGSDNPDCGGSFEIPPGTQVTTLRPTKAPHLSVVTPICGGCGRTLRSEASVALCTMCKGRPGHKRAA